VFVRHAGLIEVRARPGSRLPSMNSWLAPMMDLLFPWSGSPLGQPRPQGIGGRTDGQRVNPDPPVHIVDRRELGENRLQPPVSSCGTWLEPDATLTCSGPRYGRVQVTSWRNIQITTIYLTQASRSPPFAWPSIRITTISLTGCPTSTPQLLFLGTQDADWVPKKSSFRTRLGTQYCSWVSCLVAAAILES